MNYFSCHNHTDKSNIRLLDAINTVPSLFERAREIGLKGFAITEHECLSSHVEAIQLRKELIKQKKIEEDFKLVLGDEIYLIDDLQHYKDDYNSSIESYYHFVLLAKNKIGYKALREISSTAWNNLFTQSGQERVPITKEQLESIMSNPEYKGNVIASTACLGGELPQLILRLTKSEASGNIAEQNFYKQKINDFIQYCISIFGTDNFYLEMQPSNRLEQIIVNKRLLSIGIFYNIPVIYTTDSHYEKKEKRKVHEAFLKSKQGDREVADFYSSTYMMEIEEIYKFMESYISLDKFKEMTQNTLDIADKCENYDLFQEQLIPEVKLDFYPIKENEYVDYNYLNKMFKSEHNVDRFWVNSCIIKLKELELENDLYLTRLNDEAKELWDISDKMGLRMTSYYTTMQKIIEQCWNEGDSLIGPARGSATGFLSCYLLDITQVDPVVRKLPYWRLA